MKAWTADSPATASREQTRSLSVNQSSADHDPRQNPSRDQHIQWKEVQAFMSEVGNDIIETLIEGNRVSSRDQAVSLIRAAHARLCARYLENFEAGEYMIGSFSGAAGMKQRCHTVQIFQTAEGKIKLGDKGSCTCLLKDSCLCHHRLGVSMMAVVKGESIVFNQASTPVIQVHYGVLFLGRISMDELKTHLLSLRGVVPQQNFTKTASHTHKASTKPTRSPGRQGEQYGLKSQQPKDGNSEYKQQATMYSATMYVIALLLCLYRLVCRRQYQSAQANQKAGHRIKTLNNPRIRMLRLFTRINQLL